MKKLLLALVLLTVSCTSNIVYVEKHVYIFDGENLVEVTGSELKDNTASQTTDGTLSIPLP